MLHYGGYTRGATLGCYTRGVTLGCYTRGLHRWYTTVSAYVEIEQRHAARRNPIGECLSICRLATLPPWRTRACGARGGLGFGSGLSCCWGSGRSPPGSPRSIASRLCKDKIHPWSASLHLVLGQDTHQRSMPWIGVFLHYCPARQPEPTLETFIFGFCWEIEPETMLD